MIDMLLPAAPLLFYSLLFSPQAAADWKDVEAMLARGHYRQALDRLSEASAKTARWHLLASKAYDGLEDPAKAVEEAEEALRIEPNQPAHHVQLAQIFLSRNTPKAALEIFTDAAALFPDLFVVRLGRGLAAKQLQLYDEAERELRWCLAQQPASALAFDALATILIQLARFGDARTLATEFLQHNPSDYRGHYFFAAAAEGEDAPAGHILAALNESTARNSNFAAAHALAGKVLLRQGKARESVLALERATALRPDLVSAHLHLARAYRLTGNDAAAAREFEIVRELNAKGQQPVPSLLYRRGEPSK
jgi:tetratricopeptide (TPR) repeat protein